MSPPCRDPSESGSELGSSKRSRLKGAAYNSLSAAVRTSRNNHGKPTANTKSQSIIQVVSPEFLRTVWSPAPSARFSIKAHSLDRITREGGIKGAGGRERGGQYRS